jgi:hypothetical protein
MATPATTGSGGGFVSQLLGGGGGVGGNLMGLVGSVLKSVGGGDDDYAKAEEQREKLAKFAYGGVYAGKTDPFGIQTLGQVPQPRYVYDKATGNIIDRQQPQMAPAVAQQAAETTAATAAAVAPYGYQVR